MLRLTHSGISGAILVTVALTLVVFGGCGDDDSGSNNSHDPDAAPPQDGDVNVDAGPDAGPCNHLGALDDPCTDDCDCAVDLACRGWPGEQVCAVPCLAWDGCQDADLGCPDNVVCDLNTGACRCSCAGDTCPADEQCVMGYCVGCGGDDHCESLACTDPGADQGVCDYSTATCVCGGTCGDGVCDEAEAAGRNCPADCPGDCVEGEILPYSCPDTSQIAWCTCTAGQWDCVDPVTACPGDTLCAQAGGLCVDTVTNCYEGEIAADPQGCTSTTPLCCAPLACTGAGATYAPYSPGLCCPGLTAIASLAIMESWDENLPGMQCCSTCFVSICSPCGDGVCQLHFGETTCNCPADCPVPPFPLVCSESTPEACGANYCRQEGADCYQSVPSCVDNVCQYDIQTIPATVCDPVANLCVTP